MYHSDDGGKFHASRRRRIRSGRAAPGKQRVMEKPVHVRYGGGEEEEGDG